MMAILSGWLAMAMIGGRRQFRTPHATFRNHRLTGTLQTVALPQAAGNGGATNLGVHHALVDPMGKAAEGCRSPRRCARHETDGISPRVLECSSPLELWPDSVWPAIPHAARRIPKSASDGHAARGWGIRSLFSRVQKFLRNDRLQKV